jgi:uncharacterized protein
MLGVDAEFEWDAEKAEANLAKHGVSFEVAIGVFEDRHAIEWIDDREDYGEERFVISGNVQSALLTVVYTERGERIRIISARRATRREQEEYHRGAADG